MFKKFLPQLFWIVPLILLGMFVIPTLGSWLGSAGRAGSDLATTVNKGLEAGIVRRECEKRKADLDGKFDRAKNTYTQSVVLKVQELSTNSKLGTAEINEINKTALESIFGKPNANGTIDKPSNAPTTEIINAAAKFNQEFAKPDPALRRQVGEAILAGRTKFEASMLEVIDAKTQFKRYAEDNSVYLPTGQATIKALLFNGCIPDIDGDGKNTQGDADKFFARYDAPSSALTNQAFDNKMDSNVLQ